MTARVKVYATKAKFERGCMTIMFTFDKSQDLGGETVKDYTKAKDIELDMRVLHERLMLTHPDQGHYVSCIIGSGWRKPNGYNQLPRLSYNPEKDRLPETVLAAYWQGHEACQAGQPRSSNPNGPDGTVDASHRWNAWDHGWRVADAATIAEAA